MKTVKIKKQKEQKDIAGAIVGIVFLIMVFAIGYYLYDMFHTQEVTNETIVGDWKHTTGINEAKTDHWVFYADGTALSYQLNNSTNMRENEVHYTYVIVIPEGKTHEELVMTEVDSRKRRDELQTFNIRVTKLCKAEMDVIILYDRFTTETTRLTKNFF